LREKKNDEYSMTKEAPSQQSIQISSLRHCLVIGHSSLIAFNAILANLNY